MSPLALIVDPDCHSLPPLRKAAERAGWSSIVKTTFADARRELEAKRLGAIVASVRLGMFNGIQLAYMTKLKTPSARAILYGDDMDAGLGLEVQKARGFYERRELVQHSLTSYLRSPLPDRDRRSVWTLDRRNMFRGGRRVTDAYLVRHSLSVV